MVSSVFESSVFTIFMRIEHIQYVNIAYRYQWNASQKLIAFNLSHRTAVTVIDDN